MGRPAGVRLSAEAWEDILRLTGRNLTQVAEMADVPRSTISSLLGGHHKASVPMAHRIALALGVHPFTIFPGLRRDETQVAA